jgi:hypothetical protein
LFVQSGATFVKQSNGPTTITGSLDLSGGAMIPPRGAMTSAAIPRR